ncbi:hemagglutinin/protease, zinc metalloprotease [Legionella busanensis]|uniref:Neutral metalloproteinase n=1 Tax=Legionella busanensis TaxID=190655 RepID=A0A378JKT3_9GAMM|nr:M4 family metallopeptidase [Legionella busanensis]STX51288.1 hemagglutinin/protease, zinc metalloprotease [Legionella busanensis]
MLKKIALISSLSAVSTFVIAANAIDLYQAPYTSLNKYQLPNVASKAASVSNNQLKLIQETTQGSKVILTYQQLYKGIPISGARVMVVTDKTQPHSLTTSAKVNGQLIEELNIDTQPSITSAKALELAYNAYIKFGAQPSIKAEQVELQIRETNKNEFKLVYEVSFKLLNEKGAPSWPFFVVDAHGGTILEQWENIKTYNDVGPGGNDKIHEYWYGKDGLPPLRVRQKDNMCEMENGSVRVVHLDSNWDWENTLLNAYQYPCGQNKEELVNGAFSPVNDAYHFGLVVVQMYKNWYSLPALQTPKGRAKKLIMRVHFGQAFDNAFWDGKTMSFGDGDSFYPLVSLDVAGHEISHGFTEQHSNLEYQNQPGALNESFSDMAGLASRAYLLEKQPKLFNKTNITPNQMTWGIGETIVKDDFGFKALRFMNNPSQDGDSADCSSRSLAERSGETCKISYAELVAFAKKNIPNPMHQQSYIVHTGSGVFNKAFFLLSQKIGIQQAYHVMLTANTTYWTPKSNFINAACGVLHAAKDLNLDTKSVKTVFNKVGVNTSKCPI